MGWVAGRTTVLAPEPSGGDLASKGTIRGATRPKETELLGCKPLMLHKMWTTKAACRGA